MQAKYLVEISNPHQHIVSVALELTPPHNNEPLDFFMPSWSPGSYLMREYSRNIRNLRVESASGSPLYFTKMKKGEWSIDWSQSGFENSESNFIIKYEVYSHELTVRASHIDESHAFLHGPSYLIGIKNTELALPTIEFRFPKTWSKLTTGLRDISKKKEQFIYQAKNYDDLLDSPVEIGCHITDGFMVQGKPHHLAFYGETYPHGRDIKGDIKKITQYIADFMGEELPYDQYVYMTHLKKGLYGGLEHNNSTALQFDGRRMLSKKGYLQWISLVSHEYFHTWNIKRIRPLELGPFDYTNENYTRMLWLVEGLTSFVDELFVYQADLCSLEEYLNMQKDNLVRYFSTPARKFDSLEDSSFDAWIRLYRPDENSKNTTMSYYLKGGLVFSILNIMFVEADKSFKGFILALWEHYQANPNVGITKKEVLIIITNLIGEKSAIAFDEMLTTTEDIDFEEHYRRIGIEFEWAHSNDPYLGVTLTTEPGKTIIKSVALDSPAHKYGLNASDEIIAMNHVRIGATELGQLSQYVLLDKQYVFTIARFGKLMEIPLVFDRAEKVLKELKVADKKSLEEALKF